MLSIALQDLEKAHNLRVFSKEGGRGVEHTSNILDSIEQSDTRRSKRLLAPERKVKLVNPSN